MDRPTLGRIVHFVIPDGTECAAIVTNPLDGNTVNLHLFLDHGQMGSHNGQAVPFDPTRATSPSWHWPEKSPAVMQILDGMESSLRDRRVYQHGKTTADAPVGKVDLAESDPSSSDLTSTAAIAGNDDAGPASTIAGSNDVADGQSAKGDGSQPVPVEVKPETSTAGEEIIVEQTSTDM